MTCSGLASLSAFCFSFFPHQDYLLLVLECSWSPVSIYIRYSMCCTTWFTFIIVKLTLVITIIHTHLVRFVAFCTSRVAVTSWGQVLWQSDTTLGPLCSFFTAIFLVKWVSISVFKVLSISMKLSQVYCNYIREIMPMKIIITKVTVWTWDATRWWQKCK